MHYFRLRLVTAILFDHEWIDFVIASEMIEGEVTVWEQFGYFTTFSFDIPRFTFSRSEILPERVKMSAYRARRGIQVGRSRGGNHKENSARTWFISMYARRVSIFCNIDSRFFNECSMSPSSRGDERVEEAFGGTKDTKNADAWNKSVKQRGTTPAPCWKKKFVEK